MLKACIISRSEQSNESIERPPQKNDHHKKMTTTQQPPQHNQLIKIKSFVINNQRDRSPARALRSARGTAPLWVRVFSEMSFFRSYGQAKCGPYFGTR